MVQGPARGFFFGGVLEGRGRGGLVWKECMTLGVSFIFENGCG